VSGEAHPIRFGAVFPTSDIGDDPIAIRDYAQGVEALGYDHLIAYDHVLGAEHADREPPLTGPYDEHTPFHEPFVLFGYLAGLTRTLELVAGVIVLPQRQTALVAKQAAEVAILSGGRLRLGVGTGWNWVEYDSLGVPFRGRARRLEEQVALLRRLWAEPVVTVHTEHHDIERAGILPRPPATIPIWFGGSAEAQLRRAVRLGDGFLCTRADERSQELVRRLRSYLAEAGRDPATFEIAGMLDWAHGPEACAEATAAWIEAGGTRLALRALDSLSARVGVPALGYRTVDQQLEALRTYGELVGVGDPKPPMATS
jgi:probable F420-dependent oxidoreductase